LDLVIRLF